MPWELIGLSFLTSIVSIIILVIKQVFFSKAANKKDNFLGAMLLLWSVTISLSTICVIIIALKDNYSPFLEALRYISFALNVGGTISAIMAWFRK